MELFLENKQMMQGKPEFAWARLRLRQADSWLEFGTEDACAAGAQEATQKNCPGVSGVVGLETWEAAWKRPERRRPPLSVAVEERTRYKMEVGKCFVLSRIFFVTMVRENAKRTGEMQETREQMRQLLDKLILHSSSVSGRGVSDSFLMSLTQYSIHQWVRAQHQKEIPMARSNHEGPPDMSCSSPEFHRQPLDGLPVASNARHRKTVKDHHGKPFGTRPILCPLDSSCGAQENLTGGFC